MTEPKMAEGTMTPPRVNSRMKTAVTKDLVRVRARVKG